MIQTVVDDVLTPWSATIETIAARIAVCECSQEATKEVSPLKANVAMLRSFMD